MKKCALVTGGSRGIGRAISVRLARQGYYILFTYRQNAAEAEKTIAMIKEAGGEAGALQFDVADKEQVENVLGAWIADNKLTPIEILVNNAGVKKDYLMMMMPDDAWNEVLSTNLNSFFYVTKAVLPSMMFNKYGRIINVVSLSGIKGLPGQTNYSASKGGLIAATKALAQEVGRKNITVNAVAPGFIKTDMIEGMDETGFKQLIPMQRFGTADEVAETVAFLASKGASYITGEVININGGLYT